LWIKRRNAVGDAGWINCSSFYDRTKEEAEGTAAHFRPCRARFGGFDTKKASQASSAANETTTTFDLTQKCGKSNIIYQKPIKNQHPDNIKSAFSNTQ
jgi:hypothetical protein